MKAKESVKEVDDDTAALQSTATTGAVITEKTECLSETLFLLYCVNTGTMTSCLTLQETYSWASFLPYQSSKKSKMCLLQFWLEVNL